MNRRLTMLAFKLSMYMRPHLCIKIEMQHYLNYQSYSIKQWVTLTNRKGTKLKCVYKELAWEECWKALLPNVYSDISQWQHAHHVALRCTSNPRFFTYLKLIIRAAFSVWWVLVSTITSNIVWICVHIIIRRQFIICKKNESPFLLSWSKRCCLFMKHQVNNLN